MKIYQNIYLSMGFALLVGACTPFNPIHPNDPQTKAAFKEQKLTPKQQRLLDESRKQQAKKVRSHSHIKVRSRSHSVSDSDVSSVSSPSTPPPAPVKVKKKYPTAAPVPGKDGFVFNPYTHNIVDVKGIAPGKLCRDPEDTEPSHKFRVP